MWSIPFGLSLCPSGMLWKQPLCRCFSAKYLMPYCSETFRLHFHSWVLPDCEPSFTVPLYQHERSTSNNSISKAFCCCTEVGWAGHLSRLEREHFGIVGHIFPQEIRAKTWIKLLPSSFCSFSHTTCWDNLTAGKVFLCQEIGLHLPEKMTLPPF